MNDGKPAATGPAPRRQLEVVVVGALLTLVSVAGLIIGLTSNSSTEADEESGANIGAGLLVLASVLVFLLGTVVTLVGTATDKKEP